MKRIQSIIVFITVAGLILIAFDVQAARGVDIRIKEDFSHKSGKLGAYRALIIGINEYQDKKIPGLKTAVNDARALSDVLKTKYGFEVTLLTDGQATRKAIYQKLRDLAANATSDESILIYYAGHGEIDRVLNDGWWVPADARAGEAETYLDNTIVQKVMSSMKARHVLLIADSCYSGTLFGESRALPPLIDDRFYLNLYNEKSRWGMTSGNKTPVSDSGSEGHSIFAYQLLKALNRNERPYITTQEIYTRIAPVIANNSEQQPLCSPVRNTGDEGGGFVFVAKAGFGTGIDASTAYRTEATPVQASKELSIEKKKLEEERQALERERQEIVRMKALEDERKRMEEERVRLADEKKQLAMSKRPPVIGANEIGRDGRFIAYDNGTVLDTGTNLMWASHDNGSDITWTAAKDYCGNYRGGGYSDWRMPTLDELAGLYDAGRKYQATRWKYDIHCTELIKLSACCPWSSETRGSEAAAFVFINGNRVWVAQSRNFYARVLPVRAVK